MSYESSSADSKINFPVHLQSFELYDNSSEYKNEKYFLYWKHVLLYL